MIMVPIESANATSY